MEIHMTNRQRAAVVELLTTQPDGACSIDAQGAEVVLRFERRTFVIDEMGRVG
jgi:hypothetical protein